VVPPATDGLIASRGDSGGPVQALQRAVGVAADGIFGPITQSAVKEFQAAVGLQATGRVDPQTWEALQRATAGSRNTSKQPAAKRSRAASTRRTLRSLPALRRAANGGTPALAAITAGAPVVPPPAQESCGEPITMPVDGQLSAGFGDGRNHAGVDLTAPIGTPVVAAACGTVTQAAAESGYGNIICIRHNPALTTCYAHLSEMAVQRRAHVAAGQLIGKVGMTGRSSGPHLHFETRVGGRAQDPAPFLDRSGQ
jgi:murein DD-endopeptidase MepM/ murein hydrolase activator NlpD